MSAFSCDTGDYFPHPDPEGQSYERLPKCLWLFSCNFIFRKNNDFVYC